MPGAGFFSPEGKSTRPLGERGGKQPRDHLQTHWVHAAAFLVTESSTFRKWSATPVYFPGLKIVSSCRGWANIAIASATFLWARDEGGGECQVCSERDDSADAEEVRPAPAAVLRPSRDGRRPLSLGTPKETVNEMRMHSDFTQWYKNNNDTNIEASNNPPMLEYLNQDKFVGDFCSAESLFWTRVPGNQGWPPAFIEAPNQWIHNDWCFSQYEKGSEGQLKWVKILEEMMVTNLISPNFIRPKMNLNSLHYHADPWPCRNLGWPFSRFDHAINMLSPHKGCNCKIERAALRRPGDASLIGQCRII